MLKLVIPVIYEWTHWSSGYNNAPEKKQKIFSSPTQKLSASRLVFLERTGTMLVNGPPCKLSIKAESSILSQEFPSNLQVMVCCWLSFWSMLISHQKEFQVYEISRANQMITTVLCCLWPHHYNEWFRTSWNDKLSINITPNILPGHPIWRVMTHGSLSLWPIHIGYPKNFIMTKYFEKSFHLFDLYMAKHQEVWEASRGPFINLY